MITFKLLMLSGKSIGNAILLVRRVSFLHVFTVFIDLSLFFTVFNEQKSMIKTNSLLFKNCFCA